jgi:hypothetical protein
MNPGAGKPKQFMVAITAPLSPKSLGGAQIAGNESKQFISRHTEKATAKSRNGKFGFIWCFL